MFMPSISAEIAKHLTLPKEQTDFRKIITFKDQEWNFIIPVVDDRINPPAIRRIALQSHGFRRKGKAEEHAKMLQFCLAISAFEYDLGLNFFTRPGFEQKSLPSWFFDKYEHFDGIQRFFLEISQVRRGSYANAIVTSDISFFFKIFEQNISDPKKLTDDQFRAVELYNMALCTSELPLAFIYLVNSLEALLPNAKLPSSLRKFKENILENLDKTFKDDANYVALKSYIQLYRGESTKKVAVNVYEKSFQNEEDGFFEDNKQALLDAFDIRNNIAHPIKSETFVDMSNSISQLQAIVKQMIGDELDVRSEK